MSYNLLRPTPALTGAVLSIFVLACDGCRGEDVTFDCENQAMKFLDRADAEPVALREIPTQPPYPVAITLTEDSLNELIANVIEEGVPLAGEVPFGVLPQGPGEAEFESNSAPRLVLRPVDRCAECVVFNVSFGVQLDQEGSPLSSGAGIADLAIPLLLVQDEVAGTTTLVADYSQAFIDDWDVSVFGFDSDTHKTLAGGLKLLLEDEIRNNFEPRELMEIGSWTIGNNEVKLAVTDLILQHDLKRLVLAMNTNLPLATMVGLDLNAPLPDGAKMGVSMDPGLMLGMAHRMFEEGEIPRRYDEDGDADEDGIYGVTLGTIEAGVTDKQMRTEFRVWRTAAGYCGFANVEMPLTVAVNAEMNGVDVNAGEASLIRGDNEGIGVAAEEEESLVRDNQDLVNTFRKELSEQIGNTLNYEELGVEGSRIIFTTQDIVVSPAAISTYFDFLVLEAPPE